MTTVNGTAGYEGHIDPFVTGTARIDFEALHEPYLDFIPRTQAKILDVGAGVGRDAAVLAAMGHTVYAVEPLAEFRSTAKSLHDSNNICWIDDSLPELASLGAQSGRFDFILVSAVWHHLTENERVAALTRLAELSSAGGILALSLRNGPAGVGTHCFPTSHQQTIEQAHRCGFEAVVAVSDEPSLIPGKPAVSWSKLAFKRL